MNNWVYFWKYCDNFNEENYTIEKCELTLGESFMTIKLSDDKDNKDCCNSKKHYYWGETDDIFLYFSIAVPSH